MEERRVKATISLPEVIVVFDEPISWRYADQEEWVKDVFAGDIQDLLKVKIEYVQVTD